MRRMLHEQEDMLLLHHRDERELHPPGDARAAARSGIIKGMYLFTRCAARRKKSEPRVQLLGSGTILREVIAAAELLDKDFGVSADIWSCPSFTELRRDGFDAERWNRLHPEAEPRVPHVDRLPRRPPGPGDRRDRLRARIRRPDPRVHADGSSTPCSAPTASAAATRARTCADSSKSTATRSRMRRSPRWRPKAR